MAKYLFEASYASDGVQGLLRDGAASRRDAVESAVSGLGGNIEAFYFAFGDVDAYLIIDLPDNVAANALSLAVNQSGAVRLKTTVLLTADEIDQAIARRVEYRAPGK
jgi:uncharacterized protein with GYD domain